MCDSILNLSPCGQLAMGQPAFLSEEFTLDDPDIELITTSGHGKNGALSVLQRSVRPQVSHSQSHRVTESGHGKNGALSVLQGSVRPQVSHSHSRESQSRARQKPSCADRSEHR